MTELRNEVTKLKTDFEQRWSSQIKMVECSLLTIEKLNYLLVFHLFFKVDANNRSVFRMHDKMVMLTEWLRSLGIIDLY